MHQKFSTKSTNVVGEIFVTKPQHRSFLNKSLGHRGAPGAPAGGPQNCQKVLAGSLSGRAPAGGRLIFIHHQCWEVLPFLTIQRQRCIIILCPKDPEFYTLLALKCQKGSTSQHWWCIEISLPAGAPPQFWPIKNKHFRGFSGAKLAVSWQIAWTQVLCCLGDIHDPGHRRCDSDFVGAMPRFPFLRYNLWKRV